MGQGSDQPGDQASDDVLGDVTSAGFPVSRLTALGSGAAIVTVPLAVATDVDGGPLEVFDPDSTPHVAVGEAVAALIAIPLVFRPAHIPSFRSGRFADGGLVANFTVWAVAEEKLAYEREHYTDAPVPIVEFSLRTEQDAQPLRSRLSYLGQLASAALQGSQGAPTRFLDDVILVPLTTTLSMLDFDKGWDAYREARDAGQAAADRHLRFTLDVKPDRIRTELNTIRSRTLALINERRGEGN